LALIINGTILAEGNEIPDQVIFNSRFQGQKWNGIQLIGSVSSRFQHCDISNSNNSGIILSTISSDIIISNCSIHDNTSDEVGGGLRCYNSNLINIVDNDFSNNISYYQDGGGVYIDGSDNIVISYNEFSNNQATCGGAIAIKDGYDNVIDNNEIHDNFATCYGGGIYLITLCDITNNEIYNNQSDQEGGGVCLHYCNTEKLIDNNDIYNNTSFYGGGIAIYSTPEDYYQHPDITNCKIYGNTAEYGLGGGLFLYGNFSNFSNCEIFDNTATTNAGALGYGGGIYIQGTYDDDGACPLFQETLIYNNTAERIGGGIYFENTATPILGIESLGFYNCTITNNHAPVSGGGFYIDKHSNSSFYNTILWGNAVTTGNLGSQGYIQADIEPPYELYTSDFFYNDIENGVGQTSQFGLYVEDFDLIGYYENNIEEDPLFNNAGSDDYTLKWTEAEKSPCIDTGNPNSPLDPDGTRADIGALYHEHEVKTYEFPNMSISGNWKWLCFDILDRTPDPYNIAHNMLDPMKDPEIFDKALYNKIESESNAIFEINYFPQPPPGQWSYGDHTFSSPQGYKFRTLLAYNLEIPGFRCKQETTFRLIADVFPTEKKENWIGYFLERSQHVYNAFDGYLDNIYSIITQHWSVRNEGGGWPDVPYTLSQGDMVIVECYEDIDEFCWVNQAPAEPFIIEEPQSFSYEEESGYIPIYLSLDPEDLPTEIGALIDGECHGATVVQDTSAQICAYIIGNQGSSLEFEFYYGGRSENKLIREYNIYDPETSQTEKGSIQVENNRDCYYVSFKDEPENTPAPVKLEASNYPNPFNPVTNIAYRLPEDSQISISIYNIKGQKVKTLVTGTQPAGSYNVTWDGKDESGKDVTSGIYFYKLRTQNNEITRKMLLLK
jgi:hypothetical protein